MHSAARVDHLVVPPSARVRQRVFRDRRSHFADHGWKLSRNASAGNMIRSKKQLEGREVGTETKEFSYLPPLSALLVSSSGYCRVQSRGEERWVLGRF